jgi:hypothetical protein
LNLRPLDPQVNQLDSLAIADGSLLQLDANFVLEQTLPDAHGNPAGLGTDLGTHNDC